MKAREVMEKYSICRQTLHNWVKTGKIECERKPSGQYVYVDASVLSSRQNHVDVRRQSVVYARVSSSTQKNDLPRQVERVKSFMISRGYEVDKVYSEVASALNYERRQYRALVGDIMDGKVSRVVVEHADRLLRIGLRDFECLCEKYGTELVVIDKTFVHDSHSEIVNDMVSIIHHFSARIYSRRRLKKIENILTSSEIEE